MQPEWLLGAIRIEVTNFGLKRFINNLSHKDKAKEKERERVLLVSGLICR